MDGGEVMVELEEIDLTEWEEALPTRGYGPFHTSEALGVLDRHSSATMRLFAGYKGQQPVALLPVFVSEESVGKLVLSPPLKFGIRSLGPILMPSSPKRSKREKINTEFTRQVVDAVSANATFTLFRIVSEPEFGDPRPFKWEGCNLGLRFTYQLDLESTTPDELLKSFSRSLRREITDDAAEEVKISKRGRAGIRDVYEATERRFEEQGKGFGPTLDYVVDLIEAFDDRAAVYIAEDDSGRFISGITVLYTNDTAYFWKGGTRQPEVNVNANSLLHWRVIKDIFEDPSLESITTYDFFTANNRDITRFKRKFGGQLVPYYAMESDGLPMALAKRAYRLKRDLLA